MVDYQVIIRNRTSEIEWEQWYQQCVGGDNTTNSSDHKSIAYEWECNPAFFKNLLQTVGCILFETCATVQSIQAESVNVERGQCVGEAKK